jgi:hypothetical protein
VVLDVADRHPAGIEGDDHVVDPAQAPLALRDQPWFEAAGPVTRHVQIDVADLAGDRFRGRAVARVREEPCFRIALLITDVIGQLGLQPALQRGLDQTRHEPAIAGQLHLARIDLGEQRIQTARLTKLDATVPFVHLHLHDL